MITMINKIGWGFGRCNQFCRHCYNASTPRAPSYSLSALRAIADKICPFITDINYGTGELIVNPNARKLARYIHERYPRISQAVTTNGSTIMMMGPDDSKLLFHDVDVSLDFPDEKRHNEFRRHRQAWDWAIGALELLQACDIPRTIVTCVTSLTSDSDIVRLLALAQKFNAYWRINWFRNTGRGDASLRISATRAWNIIALLADKVRFVTIDAVFGALLGIPSKPCSAGYYTCRIHENMSVSPYPFLKGTQWDCGRIDDPSITLETIYNSPVFRGLRRRRYRACERCEFVNSCRGGCATRAILHSPPGLPDDFCPVIARLDLQRLRATAARQVLSHNLVHDGYLCTTIVQIA